MELQTLSTDDVLQIHEALVTDFANSQDPISPPGLRSRDLLESAVSRQWVGHDGILKYPDPIDNAATLLYGICCDHPFHNGNKRTALVAMLVHLDKNKLTLYDTTQGELYKLMIQVAEHSFEVKIAKQDRNKNPRRPSSDQEVYAIATWLHERSDRVTRGEKLVTYREMKRILESFGYHLENPHNNSIDVIRYESVKKGIIKSRTVMVRKHIGNIPWPGENCEVAISTIKSVRKICRLREEEGVDSEAFYKYKVVVDSFVNRYRNVLRRLARV